MSMSNANTIEAEAKPAILLPPSISLGEHEMGKQGKGQLVVDASFGHHCKGYKYKYKYKYYGGGHEDDCDDDYNGDRPHPQKQTNIFLERYVTKTIYGHFYRGCEREYKNKEETQSPPRQSGSTVTSSSTCADSTTKASSTTGTSNPWSSQSLLNKKNGGEEQKQEPPQKQQTQMANYVVSSTSTSKAVKCIYVQKYNNSHGQNNQNSIRQRHPAEDPDNEIRIKRHIEVRSSTDVAFDNHIILPEYVLTNQNQNQNQNQDQENHQQQQERYYFIVSHLADGGDLVDQLRLLDVPTANHYFRQMVEGVKYLHDLNIFHRDLKPDNIVTHHSSKSNVATNSNAAATATTATTATGSTCSTNNNGNTSTKPFGKLQDVFIIDFGQAHIQEDGTDEIEKSGKYGTIIYTAPEFRLSSPYPLINWRKADVWALGVTLYTMLVKQFPPWTMTNGYNKPVMVNSANPMFQYICRRKKLNRYLQSNNITLSNDAVDLLQRMLLENVNERISVNDILSHPWLRHGL